MPGKSRREYSLAAPMHSEVGVLGRQGRKGSVKPQQAALGPCDESHQFCFESRRDFLRRRYPSAARMFLIRDFMRLCHQPNPMRHGAFATARPSPIRWPAYDLLPHFKFNTLTISIERPLLQRFARRARRNSMRDPRAPALAGGELVMGIFPGPSRPVRSKRE